MVMISGSHKRNHMSLAGYMGARLDDILELVL